MNKQCFIHISVFVWLILPKTKKTKPKKQQESDCLDVPTLLTAGVRLPEQQANYFTEEECRGTLFDWSFQSCDVYIIINSWEAFVPTVQLFSLISFYLFTIYSNTQTYDGMIRKGRKLKKRSLLSLCDRNCATELRDQMAGRSEPLHVTHVTTWGTNLPTCFFDCGKTPTQTRGEHGNSLLWGSSANQKETCRIWEICTILPATESEDSTGLLVMGGQNHDTLIHH